MQSTSSSTSDREGENARLAVKYRPLLVLFPEIADGSVRAEHHHPGHVLGARPPLDQDYHPRDIRLVLDNASLPLDGVSKFLRYLGIRSRRATREEILAAMDENRVQYIDLIDERGPQQAARFWKVYSGTPRKDDNPEYQRKAYARVVRGTGRFDNLISIQYWLAYFFDDWANVHEMDWEMVSVILRIGGSDEQPVACVYNAHVGSFRKPWADVERVDDAGNRNPHGRHPVAYVANGSHASYFSGYPASFNVAEKYVGPRLKAIMRLADIGKDFTDFVLGFDEEGTVKCFPEVAVVPAPDDSGRWSGDWRWLNFRGRWGSPAELSLRERLLPDIPVLRALVRVFQRPIREAGPLGPGARPGACWKEPFDWVNSECFDAEPSRDWLQEACGGGD